MKNSVLVLLIACAVVSACSNERETASGQKFTVVKKGDGKDVDAKKYLVLNFLFKDGKDSVWNDSRLSPYPVIMQKKQIAKGGDPVLDVLSMLSNGDSVIVKITAKDLFTKSFHQPIPKKVDSL